MDIEFEFTGEAKVKHLAKFKKENGELRVISIATVGGGNSFADAIEGASLPTIEDLSITPADSIAAGGEF